METRRVKETKTRPKSRKKPKTTNGLHRTKKIPHPKFVYSMPKIIIHTNIKNEDIPDDFEEKVAQKVSDVVGYPIEIIYVSVTPGDRMIHNGSRDPMAFVDIDTALKFNEEVNPGYTVKFQEFFTKALNIPLSRLVLHYHDAKVSDYGVYRRAPEYKHEQYFSQ